MGFGLLFNMADWEDELDEEEKNEQKEKEKKDIDEESEEIIKKKVEYKPPAKETQNEMTMRRSTMKRIKTSLRVKKKLRKLLLG